MDASPKILDPKAPSAFPWLEADLPQRLGLPAAEFKKTRQALLTEGTDYVRHLKRICWSTDALKKAAAIFGMSAEDISLLAGDGHVVVPQPAKHIFEFKVYPRKVTNTRIVMATDGENVFRVIVKDNANFRPGMPVRCEHVQADLFKLVGNHPRFHGKY